MKKILIVTILALLYLPICHAQQDDLPIPPKRTRAAKVGGFGAFTPGWLFLDVAPINNFLQAAGGVALKDNGVLMAGGAGSVYIMFVPNLRIGGVGMNGSISSTSVDAFGVRRDAQLKAGWGGVTIEYVIPVVERFDIAIGGMLGGGGIDLILRQDAGSVKTWNDEWQFFGSGNYQSGGQISSVTRKLTGSYLVWMPTLQLEYAILGWVALRGGVSYVGMSSPSWKLDDEQDLLGVPSNVNGKGLMINAGVLVGTF
jgi:hypothetical protein